MRVSFTLGELVNTPAEALRELAFERLIGENAVSCELPTREGDFTMVGHATDANGDITAALIHGEPTLGAPVYTHVSCLLGDTFGSALCDCRENLDRAVREILAAGAGAIVYAKPVGANAFRCPAADEIDPALVSALLRHVGIVDWADRTIDHLIRQQVRSIL